MTIHLDPALDSVVRDLAQQRGTSAEALVIEALRERFLERATATIEPQDEWERRLFALAIDCGVSLSNEAVGSAGIYD